MASSVTEITQDYYSIVNKLILDVVFHTDGSLDDYDLVHKINGKLITLDIICLSIFP